MGDTRKALAFSFLVVSCGSPEPQGVVSITPSPYRPEYTRRWMQPVSTGKATTWIPHSRQEPECYPVEVMDRKAVSRQYCADSASWAALGGKR